MEQENPIPLQIPALETKPVEQEVNAYPTLRRTLFWLIILFFVVLTVLLVYQNGKSIYDNGI